MTKTYSRFLTGFFCLFLGGLLTVHLVLPDRERSETENRVLTQLPEFSWEALKDGSYTEKIEEYFADQFPLRDDWTGLKGRLEQLIGKKEFNGVYLSGDTLISKVETPNGTLVDKNLASVGTLAGKTEANVILGLIPSAAEIWKDRLPAGAQSWDQTQLLETAEKLGLPMVDFYSALNEHAGEQIYYNTDHHWTTLGAFYGANVLLEALGKDTLKENDFTVEIASDAFNGTLYSNSGVHWLSSDVMEYWVSEEGKTVTSWMTGQPQPGKLYDRSYLEKKDKYSSFLGGNQPLCVIRNETITDGSKLLLIRDSYSDALAPFLAERFEEVHLLDLRYFRMPASMYAAQNDIADIAVIYSIPNFITDNNLFLLGQ